MNMETFSLPPAGRDFRRYLAVKKRIFPIQACLNAFPTSGRLVDLGCGNGLFAGLLAGRHTDMDIIGIDDDAKKINQARKAFGDLANIRFVKADITRVEFPTADHFSLLDVLYLVPHGLQKRILMRVNRSMPRGGLLILKEMDKQPLHKYLFNMIQETVSVKLLNITLGSRFYFRNSADMSVLLGGCGFDVLETLRLDNGYLYPHILFRASKR